MVISDEGGRSGSWEIWKWIARDDFIGRYGSADVFIIDVGCLMGASYPAFKRRFDFAFL